ncbi:PREDICTED: uncharacterized protein LOC107336904 [Acropora digitifera]|uniref:uncharacterized protein LOC107336904 n=1 Tax=Acropora digitifera TaxID=70779 RepID=UPI00077B0C73|nr:PREDICTED: uncharacterized protein LOC107336904 [Acropora digitifera]
MNVPAEFTIVSMELLFVQIHSAHTSAPANLVTVEMAKITAFQTAMCKFSLNYFFFFQSAIEQYNYKGNEKDEDGFFFKGDTSVPTYYHSEKLEDPLSENWDDEDDNLQRPELIGNVPSIARTPSLSPEDRERLKRRMRSEAVSRGANPERLLRSEESPARLDFHGCSNVSPTRCREGMARAFCLLSKRTSPRA